MSTQISEIMKISNSGQIWASDGRIFRRFPVLTQSFHFASRGFALKGVRAAALRMKIVRQHFISRYIDLWFPTPPRCPEGDRDCSLDAPLKCLCTYQG